MKIQFLILILAALLTGSCKKEFPDSNTFDANFMEGKIVGFTTFAPRDLSVIDLHDTYQDKITTDNLGYNNLHWSSDGSSILFTRWEGPATGSFIYSMTDNGDNQEKLLPVDLVREFDISGDGEWISYSRHFDNQIWYSKTDGSELSSLDDVFGTFPVWSPDRNKIAYLRGWGYISVVTLSSGLVHDYDVSAGAPLCWSPDGQSLTYSYNSTFFGTSGELRTLNLSTRKTETLVEEDESISAQVWTTDDIILFTKKVRDNNYALHAFQYPTGKRAILIPAGIGSRDLDIILE